ncbi:uncharacterized protein LOC105700574 [Orussus abietinus]|uniref:uncharacterized protein LOC105700574 n=1 Tax=Orussus abietinus TaxID=222816 RepID=UPI0006264B30|nr:uncharacterized protein LOC105700574 [Orussus abietinus]
MNGTSTERVEWLRETVLPKIERVLKTGQDPSKWEVKIPQGVFYACEVYFLKLTLENAKDVQLVVKLPPVLMEARMNIESDRLFSNEITFYDKLAKYFGEDVPRCVFSELEDNGDAVIVMENVEKFGFYCARMGVRLELRYVFAGVRAIARFHGRGYTLKERCPEDFFRDVRALKNRDFGSELSDSLQRYVVLWTRRLVDKYLVKRLPEDPGFCEKIREIFRDYVKLIFQDVYVPREPLAVLCHGDFTKNNILFKEADGELKTLLIDFAQVAYCSPALDVSTFLYLSMHSKDRREFFHEVFKAYHDALFEFLVEHEVENLEIYSLKNFQEDYRRHAVIGFLVTAYFLPVIKTPNPLGIGEFSKMDTEEICDLLEKDCDSSVLEGIIDLLLEIRDLGGLDHLL